MQGDPPIEKITFAKLYAAAQDMSNGNATNNDAMSISLAKHGPVSTTSPITGGSPKSNKSELTELKTQVSQLTTCITEVMKMNKETIAAASAENEKNREAAAAEKAKDRAAEIEKENRRIAAQAEKERLIRF